MRFTLVPIRRRTSRADRRAPASGFTLVELLVVIGIIALLISILLPSLNRAREHSRQVKCLSNLRQIGNAFTMYLQASRGVFPLRGGSNRAGSEDWIYWQNYTITSPTASAPPAGSRMTVYGGRSASDLANPQFGGIAPYLALPQNIAEWEVMRCPSDDVTFRTTTNPKLYYPFSYTYNQLLTGEDPKAPKITQIKRVTEIVIVFEQSYSTLNDASFWAPEYNDNGTYVGGSGNLDLLSIAHDRRHVSDDSEHNPLSYPSQKGNALYCDGHAEYVSRLQCHNKRAIEPLLP